MMRYKSSKIYLKRLKL